MTRLPLRLRPVVGEPGHGALLRLAGRNGESRAGWFATSLGLDYREVLTGRHVEAIATRAGLNPGELARFSPDIDAPTRTVLLNGQEVALGDWSASSRRACVACCAADEEEARATGRALDWAVAHRAFLDVRSIERCPIHRLPLHNCCLGCGTELLWSRAPLGACPHGCRLSSFNARGDLDVSLERYLAARIGFGPTIAMLLLDGLPYRRVAQLLERVGRVELLGWTRRLARQTPEADAAARRLGFEMVSDWPASLLRALDGILLAASEPVGVEEGIIARYGWVYPDWLAVENDEVTALIAPIVRGHAVLNGIVARDEPMLGHRPPPTISLTAAARLSGLSRERTRALLEGAGAIPDGSKRGVAFALEPAAVAAATTAQKTMGLTRESAAVLLGTSRSRVADLLRAGLLDREGKHVAATSIETLLRLLHSKSRSQPAPPSAVPLPRACRGWGVPLAEACEAIVVGRLAVWASPASGGLSMLLVRPEDLGARRRQLSLAVAARRIGIHTECMGQLVRAGAVAI
ncbi:TniQ family protein [Glacieibacterium frigidum]|uniref:TniQ domain-containing protein n=1 Tax=Glacieibacterium frigidum TaxID=2593303 RepID=A0A552UA98_9SPHN|nr:TniQ family protein [Glacieibacterium frigidum]TRW15145.1 hypothetical protein FMM06_16005 [Glacieibacterium frigidum]